MMKTTNISNGVLMPAQEPYTPNGLPDNSTLSLL